MIVTSSQRNITTSKFTISKQLYVHFRGEDQAMNRSTVYRGEITYLGKSYFSSFHPSVLSKTWQGFVVSSSVGWLQSHQTHLEMWAGGKHFSQKHQRADQTAARPPSCLLESDNNTQPKHPQKHTSSRENKLLSQIKARRLSSHGSVSFYRLVVMQHSTVWDRQSVYDKLVWREQRLNTDLGKAAGDRLVDMLDMVSHFWSYTLRWYHQQN